MPPLADRSLPCYYEALFFEMKILLLIGILLLVGLGAFIGINAWNNAETLKDAVPPEIQSVTFTWGDISESQITIIGTAQVNNPNDKPLPVNDLLFTLDINGIQIGTGETRGLSLKKKAVIPVVFEGRFSVAKFSEVWKAHVLAGEKSVITLDVKAVVDLGAVNVTVPYVTVPFSFDTDLLSSLAKVNSGVVEKTQKIPLLGEKTIFKLTFDGLTGAWGRISDGSSEIQLTLQITNANPYPLLVPRVHVTVESNGLTLASGETGILTTFDSNDTRDVSVIVSLDNEAMETWVARHIRNYERSDITIRVFMGFDAEGIAADLLGLDNLSITLWENTQTLETDLLNQSMSR